MELALCFYLYVVGTVSIYFLSDMLGHRLKWHDILGILAWPVTFLGAIAYGLMLGIVKFVKEINNQTTKLI